MQNIDLKTANKLIYEKSPYLLQHAYNPVQWYPWGEEAFREARNQNKPIFLSIGYATCHWCHVMEKESFEDLEVAKLLNTSFINIKVDREERPDIDHIYMTVCQMMTGQGGWPLTIIMTPEQKPFFAATYIPKNNRYGRVGMLDLLPRLQKVWSSQNSEVLNSADKIVDALQNAIQNKSNDSTLSEEVFHQAFEEFSSSFDSTYGGFGKAPKFPSPHNLMFLAAYSLKYKNNEALQMAFHTTENMMRGGIFDHIEYGLHRYSVDESWHVPHFEKMLYDQATLLLALSEMQNCKKNQFFEESCEKIVQYLLKNMKSSEQLFYSGEDADSEGEEGKYYVWSYEEFNKILSDEEVEFLEKHFDIRKDGNWVDQGHQMSTNILHQTNKFTTDQNKYWTKIQKKLLSYRLKRKRPLLDDKILADWNGLLIGALARAGRTFQNQEYIQQAKKSTDALLNRFYINGQLYHRYRDKHLAFNATADDYTFIVFSLIEVFLASSEFKYLKIADELQTKMNSEFWDSNTFGYFYTSTNSEKLIARKKEVYDGAIPSSNSVAAYNLFRLGEIVGKTEYLDLSNKIFESFSDQVNSYPTAHSFFLYAYLNTIEKHQLVVVSHSKQNSENTESLQKILELKSRSFPFVAVVEINEGSQMFNLASWSSLKPHKSKSQFYICKNNVCSPPTDHLPDL